jgi:pimeloyl-ACP methyl ester carboxylesterase
VRELPLRAKLGIAGYQLWLALAWRIGGKLGTRMTRWMADKLQCPTDPATIHVGMNYPYDITWTGSHGSYRHVLPVQPKWPLLFIYGKRKPLMFHSRAWLEKLRADSRCRVVGFETRHWVQVEEAEGVNAEILEWLNGEPAD